MLFDVKTISMLQKLGLTLYGAKAYTALVSTGPTTATVLANEAEIPRTKIYETLKRLEEEKWVIAEKGRPTIYTPDTPGKSSRRGNLRCIPRSMKYPTSSP